MPFVRTRKPARDVVVGDRIVLLRPATGRAHHEFVEQIRTTEPGTAWETIHFITHGHEITSTPDTPIEIDDYKEPS